MSTGTVTGNSIGKTLRLRAAMVLALFIQLYAAMAHGLGYSEVVVADVTSRAFSVVWQVQYAAEPDLEIYTDVMGTTPARDISIERNFTYSNSSTLREAAESQGIMRVRVSGLSPNTPYFYRLVTIAKADDSVVRLPETGALPSVVTETHSLPYSNESLSVRLLQQDGTTPASGAMFLLSVEGASALARRELAG